MEAKYETKQEIKNRKAKIMYLDQYFLYRGLGHNDTEASDLATAYVKERTKYM